MGLTITENDGSEYEIIKYKRKWTIVNFSNYVNYAPGQPLVYPIVSPAHEGIEWQLHLYPKGVNSLSELFVSVYLCLAKTDLLTLKASFNFRILNADNKEVREHGVARPFFQGKSAGYPTFATRSVVLDPGSKLMKDDCLTIIARITAYIPIERIVLASESDVFDNFDLLAYPKGDEQVDIYDEGNVTFVLDHKTFRATKKILMERSPVFLKMMLENEKSVFNEIVQIVDIEEDVFREFLSYMYTLEVSDIEKFAKNLLPVANKYLVEDLKTLCENELTKQLSSENVVEILNLADHNNAPDLKAKAQEFIEDHMKSEN